MSSPSSLPVSEQPIRIHIQHVREGSKFVIKNMPKIVFDFGNCGAIKLDTKSSKSA